MSRAFVTPLPCSPRSLCPFVPFSPIILLFPLQRYGASTLVLDNRIFVSFNPFDVYVTQADVKPGCVLRAANVVQALQGRGLLTDEEVRSSGDGRGRAGTGGSDQVGGG